MPTRNADLKLNPSDFTYLKRCGLCLWLKLRGYGQKQRWDPQWRRRSGWNDRPRAVCEDLAGTPTQAVDRSLPAGQWVWVRNDVTSEPFVINHPARQVTAFIRGRPSFNVLVAEFNDGTFGLYKVKLDNAEIRAPELHAAELHAHARAFESDSRDDVRRWPISRLGLLRVGNGLTVSNVSRDDAWFAGELIDMASVWLLDQPPDPAPGCRQQHLAA